MLNSPRQPKSKVTLSTKPQNITILLLVRVRIAGKRRFSASRRRKEAADEITD